MSDTGHNRVIGADDQTGEILAVYGNGSVGFRAALRSTPNSTLLRVSPSMTLPELSTLPTPTTTQSVRSILRRARSQPSPATGFKDGHRPPRSCRRFTSIPHGV